MNDSHKHTQKSSSQLVRENDDRLELFFSQSLDGFFFMMLDEPLHWDDTVNKDQALEYVFKHQRITKVNDAMLEQYGATRKEFLGLTPADLYQHDIAYGKKVWREFFDAGRLHVETNERKLDGTPIWIEGDYICFYDDQGRITGHFGIQRDITERKEADDALGQYNKRLEILRDIERAILAARSPEEIARAAMRHIHVLIPCCRASVADFDFTSEKCRIIAIHSTGRSKLGPGTEIPLKAFGGMNQLLKGMYYAVEDTQNEAELSELVPVREEGVRAYINIPLIAQGELIGALNIGFEQPGRISTEYLEIARELADSLAVTLHHARLYEKIEHHAAELEKRVAERTADLSRAVSGLESEIAERKRTQEELRKSEERYRYLYNNTPVMMHSIDREARLLNVNDFWIRNMGYTRKDVIGKTITGFLAGESQRFAVETGLPTLKKTGQLRDVDVQFVKKSGEVIDVRVSAIAEKDERGNFLYANAFLLDITERKKAEKALRESEERLRTIGNALPDIVFVVDEDGVYLEVLTSEDNLLFEEREKLKGKRIHDIIPKPAADIFWDAIQRTLKTGESELLEYELPVPAGHRWFEGRTASLNMKIKGKKCMVFIARDITERKQAQQALQESEARFRFLYNHTPVMMKAIDVESHIITANDYYLNALGYERDEILGRKSTDFLTPESQQRIAEELNPAKLAPGKLLSTECQMITKSGKLLDAEVFAAAEFDPKGEIKQILSFFVDRTDRKRAEALQNEKLYLQEELQSELNFGEIIGTSKAIKAVFQSIEMVAATDSTVLLLGETGTGKELIARAIHRLSNRRDHVLIKVNCGALPAGLVESELFGHEKGAFTGATTQKKGRFELADNGTIFLDEVGELPPETQTKLLRVLQEQEFERVGGAETLKVNVRVIAATNRDLEGEVKEGNFRADLYYRLNIFPIRVPPLRERKEDIPLLALHFVRSFGERMGKQIERINPEALEKLQRFDWPGNVRELANILERAVIVCQGKVLQKQHISGLETGIVETEDFPTLEELERRHIMAALEKTGGVLAGPKGAAALLNMHRSTLWARMQKLGIGGAK